MTMTQTPQHQMMTVKTSPLSPVNHLRHCSHRAPSRRCSSRWGEQSLSLLFSGVVELDALFEDHGVCCAVVADMLTLERAAHHRCTPRDRYLSQTDTGPTGRNALASWQISLPPPFSRHTLQISILNFWTSLTRGPKGVTTTITSSTSFPWQLPGL